MVSRNYQDFTPSHKAPPGPSCKRIGEVPAGERLEISIYLKPRDAGGPGLAPPATRAAGGGGVSDPRAQLAATRATQHANDFKLVQEFASDHALSVISTEPA